MRTGGADRPGWATGFGRLRDHPAARITALSEHHAVVEFPKAELSRTQFPRGATIPRLGDRVHVIPNHVCNAVNLADELIVDDTERWPVVARGANS